MSYTRAQFAHDLLYDVAEVSGWAHIGARRAIVAWMIAESGTEPCNGIPGQGANFNPLNTTLSVSGSKPYNSANVQNYPTYLTGVWATSDTLREGYYVDVVAALKRPLVKASTVLRAVGASPWGTSTDLLLSALARYSSDRSFYNQLPVG